jgi:hypothetical protein
MLRKALAVFLVFLCIVLAGFDLLEDLDVPIRAGINSAQDSSLPNARPGLDLVNNIFEWGDRTPFANVTLCALPATELPVDAPTLRRRVSKIHKLHHVFLI